MTPTSKKNNGPSLSRSIAETVRAARARRQLSQVEVATKAGTSTARVSEIENELSDPRLSTVERIAKALGVTITVSEAA